VCFSDHGEDLNWLYSNDKWWKTLWHPEEKWHWCLLYDQTQKVLLTIKDKNFLPWKNIKNQVRLVDMLPTIISLFNFESKLPFDWISLVNMADDNVRQDLVWYSETYYPEEQKEFHWISNKKSYRIGNEYKIIENIESWKNEIYELKKDELELCNLLL
jgi:arylsulfatase A-like enzyme